MLFAKHTHNKSEWTPLFERLYLVEKISLMILKQQILLLEGALAFHKDCHKDLKSTSSNELALLNLTSFRTKKIST